MSTIKKKLPVGIDEFNLIREEDYYYLDKTKFIGELIRSRGMVNLFTRPRRFGKTLIMSMLKSFFEIGSDPALFHGLAIEQETDVCEKYRGKFPVVSISLKEVEGETYEEALSNLSEKIAVLGDGFSYLLNSDKVSEADKVRLKKIIDAEEEERILKYSLSTLMRMLRAHYGKRVILLIDEYDVPLDKSNENGYYDRMVMFLRTFFGSAFKTNPDLHFAVLTGCLRISKESIFTGVNNLSVDSISNTRFDEYFGFTDRDVRTILADYGLSDRYEEMREWYDGYHFGDTDVYCPWDVVNHCDMLRAEPGTKPQSYWNNISSNAIIKVFIDKADSNTREDIEKLIAGEAIERRLTENLTYSEIDESIENLWSVLYLTGYLTKDRKQEAENPDYVRLVIPNREVRDIFVDKIRKWFAEKIRSSAELLNELYGALLCGDAVKVETIVSSQLRYAISYHDHKEDFYHGFLIGLLSGNQEWEMRSNREMGNGRSDIALLSADRTYGVVIEIKRAERETDMESKCDEALCQIEEKRYAEYLTITKTTVWIYGIAFAGKQCHAKAKKLK